MANNLGLLKKLKGLQKRSPVFFQYTINRKKNEIVIIMDETHKIYSFGINDLKPENDIIREVYLKLRTEEYPRMRALNGEVYVVDKVDVVKNILVLKPLSNPDSESLYACRLKMPVIKFLSTCCNANTSEDIRWRLYCEAIDLIWSGDDIYEV